MTTSTLQKLERCKLHIEQVIEDLNAVPSDKVLIAELLDALAPLEERYEDFCQGCDEDFGEAPGTTYQDGTSMEFYIESNDWHRISLVLRKIRNKK